MYSDYFAIENAARDYRNEREAQAAHERRLALLASTPSPLALLRGRALAARAALTWRPSGTPTIIDRRRHIRPTA